ncbi:SDR family oxidoreductase [Pisciglobus halotolerans]|uniref:NAD(P)H dehydrogenase (Quinone) n=1 Tax=Pisciglobus halotolerans TaxID=745365 RepID=A0A1I3BLN3_9LACT|nr:SDR family oxidoreductase [Pisciglobus halotolerans]SFH63153.1 NAD(P)H dehydrogenase (quinone) [Pisciglobus halotolerans]
MNLLVTGATGMLGEKVVQALMELVPAESISITARKPEKAAALKEKGVTVHQADYEDPLSLEEAFTGVDRLLLISSQGDDETRIRQHQNVIQAAKTAAVSLLVYTSCTKADSSTLPVAEVHRQTEASIRQSGLPYVFLRNNWYIENEIDTVKQVLNGGPVLTAAGDGRVGWLPRVDYAEAAAVVLAENKQPDKTYELSGIPYSYADMAKELSLILGKNVPVRNVDERTYREVLLANGTPEPFADFACEIQVATRKGDLEVHSHDLSQLINRPTISLHQSLTEIVHKFYGKQQ